MSTSQVSLCSKGHSSKRRKNGNCIQCEKDRYHSDPKRKEYVKTKQAERRKRINDNPEMLKEKQAYMRDYVIKNKDRLNNLNKELYRKNNIKIRLQRKNITITQEIIDYISNHSGVCDICNNPPDGRWGQLVMDHCHKTNSFRGMLCNKCNKGIGLLFDNPSIIESALVYIKHHIQYRKTIPNEFIEG